jgi:hypothetical protein
MKVQVLSANVELVDKEKTITEWTIGIDKDLPEVLFRELMISIINALAEHLQERGWDREETNN